MIISSNPTIAKIIELNNIDAEIENAVNQRPFNKYLVLLGGVLGAGGFAVFFGGTLLDAVAAAIAGFVVSIFNMHKVKFQSRMLYSLVVSFIGAIVGLLLFHLGVGDNIDMIMIGTIMLVIPGLAFGNAVRDLLFGDTVSGIIQLVQAVLPQAAILLRAAAIPLLLRAAHRMQLRP